MRYRDITADGALAIATTIRSATNSIDRNEMVRLHKRHGGIKRITKLLVTAGFMTKSERKSAINTMPKINNPSLRCASW
jgi:hypothetical protein